MSQSLPSRLESGLFELSDGDRITTALPRLVAEVARATTTLAVASQIARSFVLMLGARTARVYLTSPDRRTLHLVAAENVDVATRAQLFTVSMDDDLPAAVAARSGLLHLMDAADAPTFGRPHGDGGVARAGGGVALGLPLFAGTTTSGAVSAGFDSVRPKQSAALSTLSEALGALVERARLREEVERLEAAIRMRDERTALAVHDLRQPLNVMILSAGHLARRADGEEQRSLGRLRASGLLLDRMISDLSDASLLETGKFTLHVAPTDLVELVNTARVRHAPGAQVSVEGDIPCVAVDPQRVEQVMTNLLVNAQKYGCAGGAPHVELARHDSAVVVSVTNDGDGIPDEERTKVFDLYYRARDHRPRAEGLGLGLYICRKVVEQHGGRIWVDGDSSHTRFSFSLPLGGSP